MDVVIPPARLESLARAKVDTVKSTGGTEVSITDMKPTLHPGRFAAIDFTTSYVMNGVKTVMWSRYIAGPKSFVVVSAGVTGAAIAAEPLGQVRDYYDRTVAGVVAI
ncbi:MAG TPA: hypothetical protein VM677_20925 [Actinokineospora sp.]|nr:hypothetical protein [Actinokineospora sp.]